MNESGGAVAVPMELRAIGQVRSPILTRQDMPLQGVKGSIEIDPEYVPALEGIEGNSHLILLCWMHLSDRKLLQARARKIAQDLPLKGVFALRSPSRSNPISYSVVQLLKRAGERILEVDYLDLIDGTPVLDIKPYQPGWDCVFSAVTQDRTEKIRKLGPSRYRQTLVREAVSYHGEWCPGAAMAVRIAEKATVSFGDLRRNITSVNPGNDSCIADGLIGITGARLGNGRLIFPMICSEASGEEYVKLTGRNLTMLFILKFNPMSPDEILETCEEDIFRVETTETEETVFREESVPRRCK